MAHLNLKERDLVHWLESKIQASSSTTALNGSSNEFASPRAQTNLSSSWGCRHVTGLLSSELLIEIQSCFVDLQTPVKLKLLLSMLHLSRRSLDQWRNELEDLISLAQQDIDEWVQTIAELLKDFPSSGRLSFDMSHENGQFVKTVQVVKKMLKKQVKESSQILPLEAGFMNKSLVQTVWGSSMYQSKHFTLKRKTKAAVQRVEFLQKSHDAPNLQKLKNAALAHVVPIRGRDTVRKMETNSPLRGIPSQNPGKMSSGFTTASKMYNRPTVTKKEGGAKLIDITETPEMLRKRRKEMEVEEKAAKKVQKEEQKKKREQDREEAKERKRSRLSESIENAAVSALLAAASAVAANQNDESDEGLNDTTPTDESEDRSADQLQAPPSYLTDLLEAARPLISHQPAQPVSMARMSSTESINNARSIIVTSSSMMDHFNAPSLAQTSASASVGLVVANDHTFAATASPLSESQQRTGQNFRAIFGGNIQQQAPMLYGLNANFSQAFASAQQNPFLQQSAVQFTNARLPVSRSLFEPTTSTTSDPSPRTVLILGGAPPTNTGNQTLQPQGPPTNQQQEGPFDPKFDHAHFKTTPPVNQSATPLAPSGQAAATVRPFSFFSPPALIGQQQPQPRQSDAPRPVATLATSIGGGAASTQPVAQCYTISRNVVAEAQEMFKTANKLTRPEKALILGFMAGNRENPCPQMGSILTVRLSENVENQMQPDGALRQAIVETYFQMNYENGEWKKLRKTRLIA